MHGLCRFGFSRIIPRRKPEEYMAPPEILLDPFFVHCEDTCGRASVPVVIQEETYGILAVN